MRSSTLINGNVVSDDHVVTFTADQVMAESYLGTLPASPCHCLPSVRLWSPWRAVIKSAIPYLAMLLLYGVNGAARILPTEVDLDCVHLHNVSAMEVNLIGFSPHKLVSSVSLPALDVLAAAPYLLHYTLPVLYPALMLWRGRPNVVCSFYWLIGVCSWVHYFTWYVLPTAPPWFYDTTMALSSTLATEGTSSPPVYPLRHKEGCAFARLDAMTGIPFFFNMFASNPVPFASFPSGHVGWPMCILGTVPPGGRVALAAYVAWVVWATLYSCHHYLSDAVAAILIVIVTQRVMAIVSERREYERQIINIKRLNCACYVGCPMRS